MSRYLILLILLLLQQSCSFKKKQPRTSPLLTPPHIENRCPLYKQADTLLSKGEYEKADSLFTKTLKDTSLTTHDRAHIEFQQIIIKIIKQDSVNYDIVYQALQQFMQNRDNERIHYRAQLISILIETIYAHNEKLSEQSIDLTKLTEKTLSLEKSNFQLREQIKKYKELSDNLTKRIKLLEEVILELSGVQSPPKKTQN